MKDRSKFQKGSGCYKCGTCGKQTRSTGRGDNENCGLCVECFDLSSIENNRLDNGDVVTMKDYGNEIKATFAKRPELAVWFPELKELLEMPTVK